MAIFFLFQCNSTSKLKTFTTQYIQIQLHLRTVICRSEMYNGPEHLEIWWIIIYCEGIRILILLCIVDGETGMANIRMTSIVYLRVI